MTVTPCYFLVEQILYPFSKVFSALVLSEKEPHCPPVVRILAKSVRDKRSKALGLKMELSDRMAAALKQAL